MAKLLVDQKGSIVTRIRNACKETHLVCVYRRKGNEKKDDGSAEKGGLADAFDIEDDESGGDTSVTPKKQTPVKKRRTPRLVLQANAYKKSHGFEGLIGYMEGHPKIPGLLKEMAKKPASVVVFVKQVYEDNNTSPKSDATVGEFFVVTMTVTIA